MARPLPSIIASTAWAIDGAYPLAALAKSIEGRSAADVSDEQLRASGRFLYFSNPDGEVVSSMETDYGRRIKQGAVAIIPAKGVMVKECARWMEFFGFCSSERVARDIDFAAADDRVKQIVCVVASPGGDIAGIENLDRTVKAAAAKKKITAFADNMMASAAYWGFAHATTIVADGSTTTVGSLGVMVTIEDDSAFWKAMGIDTRDIYDATSGDKNREHRAAFAGDNKPMQDRLAPLKAAMVAAVTDGRKGLIDRGREDVLTGKVYSGNDAKAFGLIDRIDSLKAVIGEAIQPDASLPTPPPIAGARAGVRAHHDAPQPNSIQAHHDAPQPNTDPMNLKALFEKAWNKLGFADAKKEFSAEEITSLNTEIKETGLALVTSDQAKELAGLADLKTRAAKADELQAKVTESTNALQQMETGLAAALKECGIEAEASKALEVVTATLKKSPAATPTGAAKTTDQKPKEWDSVKAFEQATSAVSTD